MTGISRSFSERIAATLCLSGVLCVASCGGGAVPASTAPSTANMPEPATPVAVTQPGELTPAVKAPTPVPTPKPRVFQELAVGDAKAPWLAAALAKRPAYPFELRNIVGLGKRVAVARTRAGYYALRLRKGIVGPMVVPGGGRVVGVDGRDGIVAVDDSGVVYRAATATAGATPGGFKRMGKGPAAADANAVVSYDVAGKWVIAVTSGTLWISRNRGKTFRVFRTKKQETVERALVRADGNIVLRMRNSSDAAAKTYVSRRGGKAKLATFQATGITRIGQWIMDSGAGQCTAVLAKGGRRWVRDSASPWKIRNARLSRWQNAFGHGILPARPLNPVATLATAVSPRMPRFSTADEVTGSDKNCPSSGGGGGYGTGGGGSLADIAGLAVKPSRHESHFMRDSVSRSHSDRVVRTDAGAPAGKRVSFANLPKDCDPLFSFSVRGLGLLGCRHGANGSKLRLVEQRADGTWSAGYELPEGYDARPGYSSTARTPRRAFSIAPDGTIAMVPHCTKACGVYVRNPVAAGVSGAWKRIVVPDAHAYRVVPGGRVVALVSKADFTMSKIPRSGRAPVAVQFVLADGGGLQLLAEIKVGARLSAFAVAGQQVGMMLLNGKRYAPFMVAAGGGLIPAQ